MRIAICDDEEPQRLLLKRYVEEWARRNKVILDTELFVSGEIERDGAGGGHPGEGR